MASGATLVLVSHDPGAIERVCRRLVVLDQGRVAFDGEVAEGLLFYHRLLGTERGGSSSLRPGERTRLEVVELELKDADGRARHVFRPGEPMRVEITVAAAQPAERAVVALEVRDRRGQTCFRTDTTVGALQGRAAVSFEVPRLTLLGGDYDLAVGSYDHDAPPSGMLDRLAGFAIAPTSDGEGIVDLRGEWSVERLDASERVLR
jgi:ABC-type glutathione transport system ATPase component